MAPYLGLLGLGLLMACGEVQAQTAQVPDITVNYGGMIIESGSTIVPDPPASGEQTTTVSFSIYNVTDALLSGVAVTKDGPDADFVEIVQQPAGTVTRFNSAVCQLSFTRKRPGPFQVNLHIASNDPDESPYELVLADELPRAAIQVERSTGEMVPYDSTEDMGTRHIGASKTLIYKMTNVGTTELRELRMFFTRPYDFRGISMSEGPQSQLIHYLAPGQSVTKEIRFMPQQEQPVEQEVMITCQRPLTGQFKFRLRLAGEKPKIQVKTALAGSYVDDSEFNFFYATRTRQALGTSASQTFTISSLLTQQALTDLSVGVSGPHAGDFQITRQPSKLLFPYGAQPFTVKFTSSAPGRREAVLTITGDQPNSRLLRINLVGTGHVPTIEASRRDTSSGEGVQTFFKTNVGQSRSMSFTIYNSGAPALEGLTLTKDGAHADDFVIKGRVPARLAGPDEVIITVEFTPRATGLRTAVLHLQAANAPAPPVDIHLSGEGVDATLVLEDENGLALLNGTTLDLGALDFGQSVTRALRLRNPGTQPLTLSKVDVAYYTTANFLVPAIPANTQIAPGESLAWPVTFRPLVNGLNRAVATITSDDMRSPSIQLTLTGQGRRADFLLNPPLLPDWSNKWRLEKDLGTVPLGVEVSASFTIKNTGSLPLTTTVLNLAEAGLHPGDFSVTKAPASPLAPGEETIMTVRFAPQAQGERRGFLLVRHNGLQGDFDLKLKAICAPRQIAFTAEAFYAAHGDYQGEVTLTRSPGPGTASVMLDVTDGVVDKVPPVASALAGTDYPRASRKEVTFAAGQWTVAVPLRLLSPAGRAGINRQLMVSLSQPSSGYVLGYPATAKLRIVPADMAKPTLTLSSPAAGRVTGLMPLLVTGRAGDARGIERVEVKLNDGAPVRAALGATAASTSVPFSLAVTPVEGPNVLVVTAYDLRGNSSTVTRAITFTERRRLTVNLYNLSWAGEAAAGGTVTVTATPADPEMPAPTTRRDKHSTLKTFLIKPGTPMRLLAKARSGLAVRAWQQDHRDLPTEISYLADEVAFTMPDHDVNLEASVENSILAYAGRTTPTMYWLLGGDSDPARPDLRGYLTGVITSGGSFSGRLLMAGQSISVAAIVPAYGEAAFLVGGEKRTRLPLPGGGELKLESMYYEGFKLTYLPAAGTEQTVTTRTPAFSSSWQRPVPAMYLNSATQGRHTVRLGQPEPAPPQEAALYPRGFGYATVMLAKTGGVTLAGVLADGTAVTMSTALVSDQSSNLVSSTRAPVYVQLPTPGDAKTKLGLLFGELDFTRAEVADISADLRWYRPAAAAGSDVRLYPAGWPAGVDTELLGALYDSRVTVQSALGLGPVTASSPGNAQLDFLFGGLLPPITKVSFNIAGNSVVKLAPADGSYTLTLSPATGMFSGSFTPNWANPAAKRPAFNGVILQHPSERSGYGFFLNNAVSEPAPESGAVLLGAP